MLYNVNGQYVVEDASMISNEILHSLSGVGTGITRRPS